MGAVAGLGTKCKFSARVKLSGNVVWTNTLPYVIIGGLQVDTTPASLFKKEQGCICMQMLH